MTVCHRCEAAAKVCDALIDVHPDDANRVYRNGLDDRAFDCAAAIRAACIAAGHANKDAEIVAEADAATGLDQYEVPNLDNWLDGEVVSLIDRLADHIEGEKP